jgi:hypothetical protein
VSNTKRRILVGDFSRTCRNPTQIRYCRDSLWRVARCEFASTDILNVVKVEKVWFLSEIQGEARPDMKSSQMSMFNGNIREAESTLLQAGRVFGAIMLNIQTFRFDK